MKSFLLFLTLFLFIDFHGSSEEFSTENLLSQSTHENFLVLHSLKAQCLNHSLKLNLKLKFLKVARFCLKTKVFSKKLSYFHYLGSPKHAFEWGPQNLATPPPYTFS